MKTQSPSVKARNAYEKAGLRPALVPSPLWGRSVCKSLGSSNKAWRLIREHVMNLAAGNCKHCGAHYDKGMVCHEVWVYDDQNHIATLTEFNLVCRDCDAVLHIGFTLIVAGQQEAKEKPGATVDRGEQALAHLQTVNCISESLAKGVIEYAFEQFAERSKHTWQIRISPTCLRIIQYSPA